MDRGWSSFAMFVALIDSHLAVIAVSLAVAAYMFAAIPFPALRVIFRLKGFAARGMGVDHDANRRLGESLGLVLCPLIGIGALGVGGLSAMDWKRSGQLKVQLIKAQAARQQALILEAKEILSTAAIDQIYFETVPRRGVTEQGRIQIEGFLRELGSRLGPDALATPPESAGSRSEGLTVIFKPVAKTNNRPIGSIFPEHNGIGLWSSLATGVLVHIPQDLEEQWHALGKLEKTDLIAIEREQNRLKKVESDRLSNYAEKTFAGPASWEIYDAVNAVAPESQEEKKKGYVGTKVDWECEFSYTKEKNGRLEVIASQSRPDNKGSNFVILFDGDPSQLPKADGLRFARVRGTIESMDKGIGLNVNQFDLFTP